VYATRGPAALDLQKVGDQYTLADCCGSGWLRIPSSEILLFVQLKIKKFPQFHSLPPLKFLLHSCSFPCSSPPAGPQNIRLWHSWLSHLVLGVLLGVRKIKKTNRRRILLRCRWCAHPWRCDGGKSVPPACSPIPGVGWRPCCCHVRLRFAAGPRVHPWRLGRVLMAIEWLFVPVRCQYCLPPRCHSRRARCVVRCSGWLVVMVVVPRGTAGAASMSRVPARLRCRARRWLSDGPALDGSLGQSGLTPVMPPAPNAALRLAGGGRWFPFRAPRG
jgi:hypothetical protein